MAKQSDLVTWMKEAFLDWVMQQRPSGEGHAEYLDSVFSVGQRLIVDCKVLKPISLSGIFMGERGRPVEQPSEGSSTRQVCPDSIVTVRHDVRDTFYDVEVTDVGVFRLNKTSFEGIKDELLPQYTEWPKDFFVTPGVRAAVQSKFGSTRKHSYGRFNNS